MNNPPKSDASHSHCHGKLKHTFGECLRKPTVFRDGVAFCWQHDPGDPVERQERAKAERMKRWEEIQEMERKFDAKAERRKLEAEAEIDNLSNSDLKKIVELGGIYAMLSDLDKNQKMQE